MSRAARIAPETAQAQHPCAAARIDPHYALTQEHRFRLHRLGCAMAGIARLTCPDDQDQAREDACAAREDIGAIFELMQAEVEAVLADLRFVTEREMADGRPTAAIIRIN